jgi:hypothetical protein
MEAGGSQVYLWNLYQAGKSQTDAHVSWDTPMLSCRREQAGRTGSAAWTLSAKGN